MRETEDVVEAEGVRRAKRAAERADLRLFVDVDEPDFAKVPSPLVSDLYVRNKVDLGVNEALTDRTLRISALTGEGFEVLEAAIETWLADQVRRCIVSQWKRRTVHAAPIACCDATTVPIMRSPWASRHVAHSPAPIGGTGVLLSMVLSHSWSHPPIRSVRTGTAHRAFAIPRILSSSRFARRVPSVAVSTQCGCENLGS